MTSKTITFWQVWLMLALALGFITACGSSATEPLPEIETYLLVRAPDQPLPANKSIEVRSQTEAAQGVAQVNLIAVELPTGEKEVLLWSNAAPNFQTSFVASQQFTPLQPGHYVIKVVGYNRLGGNSTSDYIGFDVVNP
jgi:hypothetical protein